jgi:antitoxin CptB
MESPADDLAIRRRRALYRATHRGSKELDFLLGRFAEQTIETMSEAELCVLERLIDAPDPDIAVSLFEGNSLGQPELDALMQRLRHFHGIVQGRVSSC